MKKLLYIIALGAITGLNSYAQDARKHIPESREKLTRRQGVERFQKLSPNQRAEMTANNLQQRLNLSADQKQKIQQIELERIKMNDEWRKQDQQSMNEKMESRKAFIKSNRESISRVLTEEQRKIFESSQKNTRERLKDRYEKRTGRPEPHQSPAKN